MRYHRKVDTGVSLARLKYFKLQKETYKNIKGNIILSKARLETWSGGEGRGTWAPQPSGSVSD